MGSLSLRFLDWQCPDDRDGLCRGEQELDLLFEEAVAEERDSFATQGGDPEREEFESVLRERALEAARRGQRWERQQRAREARSLERDRPLRRARPRMARRRRTFGVRRRARAPGSRDEPEPSDLAALPAGGRT